MKQVNFGHLLIACSIIFQTSACGQTKSEFTWPNGAKAAICLTYDDGLSSHVNTVGPALKKYNFKATFYPTLASSSIYDEMDKWKLLAQEGHELGNHSLYHPCQKSKGGMDWVKDYQDLDKYTVDQLLEEIQLANSFLSALDGKKTRTFAYPCAHYYAGGVNYKDSISKHASAARGSSGRQESLQIPDEIDIYNITSWAPNNHDADDLIAYIDKIIESNSFSTFTFHGIGAEHLVVSKEDHEAMLKYLDAHRDKIWVTTFKEATDYLRSQQLKK
ncbi:polysaccharide deacetylase family protein [Fulvivirga sp.]|uniref:polysaccharide deacetylase family protein n=1 Tax=Fulvivirga sp. TaxID=1931237 RepID=UPI0032EE5AA4